jgi:hypothetical protein
MKINKIIKLSNAFATEVNVLRDYRYKNPEGNEQKIKGYLPNKSSRDVFKNILLNCSESTDKKLHLITASYGTGKSYLLLMLANLLDNNKRKALESLIEKINDKEEFYLDKLSVTLDNHLKNTDPFLIVIPEYGDPDFDHALLEGLKYALKNNDIDYIPKTNYEEAIKTIKHWETKNPQDFKLLKDLITNTTVEKFVEQLHAYNPNTYSAFKNHFKEISGASYSDSHTSAYPVFADTAKAIRKQGFRGIAIIYDEFGEMLGKLINSSSSATGISVQQFLEDVKDKKENCNIIFISAGHQDPQSLRASKERELNKIIGRFERHQLIVSEAEGEEIIGTIFIKEDLQTFKQIYKNALFQEHLDTIKEFNLYPDKGDEWIEIKILKNLYPLHPLTSYILPRLSSEFAQNTRSMFNFLSPTETKEGAFKDYLESENVIDDNKVNLFTPHQLLDFFLKNIREDKEGRVQSLYEVYRVAIGKSTDHNHKIIIKNLFILWVVSNALIKPNKETLFWAMNWEEARRNEFYNLLDDLVEVFEYIELNPTDKTYQFPDFGAAPLSKVINEELKKLDDLSLTQCLPIWNEILNVEDLQLHHHNNRFGCNRKLSSIVSNDAGHIVSCLVKLEAFYNNNSEYFGNGYVFYLIGQSENELEELKQAIINKPNILPYIVFATPVNLPQFDNLIKETQQFKAVKNTTQRQDVIQNPARFKSIQDQFKIVTGRLEEKIKSLYEPSNWKWNYQQESNIDIATKPKFSNWINPKMDLLFSETPNIKDEALWYTDGTKGATYRKQALILLFNAEKDRIPLRDDSNNAADRRIIRAFFANIGLTSDKKRERSIQYGDIKMPEQDCQVYKAWKLIDNKIKSGHYINISEIINPLLQAPFGLSEHIIKFLLASYIRYDIERITISDRRSIVQTISPNIIECLFNKPSDYSIRKIEISGPELRYLNQLKNLFEKQEINSWVNVAQKFIGISQYLTSVQKGVIKDSGDKELQEFYASIEYLKGEFLTNTSNKEKISQDFFLEHLPTLLLNEGRSFLEDPLRVTTLINKLNSFKKYPLAKEVERKMDVIQALAKEVFGKRISTKAEITEVVTGWFKNLPAPNQSGKFSNEIINRWILKIKMSVTDDPFEVYLETLNANPFKDWEDFSFEKYNFIGRFRDYKRIIEEYTKSPVEILQIIAREAFEEPASQCTTEHAFDTTFKKWWDDQPEIKKAEHYSRATNLFISQITLPSAVKARYLETIPQSWKEFDFLPKHIPIQWESWSNSDASAVAEKYKTCIKEVIDWKPPIEEKQFFNSLGAIFNDPHTDSISSIFSLVVKWYSSLPIRTKEAPWESELVSKFFTSIKEPETFRLFISEDVLFLWNLPPFKLWNESLLNDYIKRLRLLKEKIDDFKRPLFEVVEKIEAKTIVKSKSTDAFCFNLKSKIKESEAYKNKIKSEILEDKVSIVIYNLARENNDVFSLPNIINLISNDQSINRDWHVWSANDEKTFVKVLNKGIDYLLKWKFPEVEKIKKAKVKVKQSLNELQRELSLNDDQMRKVLNDIIDNK